jgi:hypothetical protein
VPITFADKTGKLAGDGMGPLLVSLDGPSRVAAPNVAYPDGRLLLDQLGTANLAALITLDSNGRRQINPNLLTNKISVIKDTHGKTSQLSAEDIDALSFYLKSLQ